MYSSKKGKREKVSDFPRGRNDEEKGVNTKEVNCIVGCPVR